MEQIRTYDQAVCNRSILWESKPRVLVVDDDHHVATVIRDILVYKGFEVQVAESGRQALSLLRGGHDIELLITDMRMPEVDGLELLREIHFLKECLPVIVLTGYPTVRNGFQAITAGACEYLVKPFKIEDLLGAIVLALRNNRHEPVSEPGNRPT
jgi:DNA-binding NtrC family response regulator